jgi:hypothetical protein
MSSRSRNSTFVSPADGELPRLKPLARMPDIEGQDVDPGKLFGRTPIHTHERRDPLTEAQAFMLKYAGLTVILLVLAVGLTLRLEWHYTIGIVVFALMATGAYWLLSFTESLFTGPGVERHRLSVGGRVLTRQIEADERVRLAQVALQVDQLALQREYNQLTMENARRRAGAQVEAHHTPQDGRNGRTAHLITGWHVAELEPPRFAQGAAYAPRADPVRAALLACVVDLYATDDGGRWANMDAQGYVRKGYVTPWSQRGGHTAGDRDAMVDLIHRSRFAQFDDGRRTWRVSVGLYPDAQAAIDAIGGVNVM